MVSQSDKAVRFRRLHQAPGVFVLPNPWDGASARILAGLGFPALATSSHAPGGWPASRPAAGIRRMRCRLLDGHPLRFELPPAGMAGEGALGDPEHRARAHLVDRTQSRIQLPRSVLPVVQG